ncbi:hypothetical protein [Ruegeria atlantica]|uniref:hypothetical protein n=1 Tax=Ruegeria atlantica TaxID=81569 RepID=UPI00147DA029|nr:hypothetical protein [Ruegeria atlantica]
MAVRAHMASYPLREKMLPLAVQSIIDQVDALYLCLNEWGEVPAEYKENPKIHAFVPEEDQKDVGKFFTTPDPDDIVFFVDDDLIYSEIFVKHMVQRLEEKGPEKVVFGTHASTYTEKTPTSHRQRDVVKVGRPLRRMQRVDQLATCGMVAMGKNVAPYEFMKDSQKFVDVRYARWLYENGVESWAIDRQRGFVGRIPAERDHETIFKTFTRRTPPAVLAEISVFASRSKEGVE